MHLQLLSDLVLTRLPFNPLVDANGSRFMPMRLFWQATSTKAMSDAYMLLRMSDINWSDEQRRFKQYVLGSPRFQCNNWRYAKLALARGWYW
jgi:hypothetical protein